MRTSLAKIVLAVFGFAVAVFLSCADSPTLEFPGETLNSASSSSLAQSNPSVTPSSSSIQSIIIYGPSVDYEGETYETVVIGTQTWFKRNLNYDASGSKCYENKTYNCTRYGRLYSWVMAMAFDETCESTDCASKVQPKHKGICPQDWHIPSDKDWNILMQFVNPSCVDNRDCAGAGTKLKATSGWNGGNGTDDYGFSALPGGSGYPDGNSFGSAGDYGSWWSTSEDTATPQYAHLWGMVYAYDQLFPNFNSKFLLYSVRCLKN